MLLGLILIIPFVLNIVGINILQFGSVGGISGGSQTNLLRSTNGGQSWEGVSISENKKISFPGLVYSISFHPLNPNLILMGTRASGLWKSINGGASWTQVADQANVLGPRGDVYKAVFSPSNPDRLYVVSYENSRGRLLRSDDQGKIFREVYFVSANRVAVSDVFVYPTDPDRVVIVTAQGGVLETRNGGTTWRVVKWFTEGLTTLVVNPASTNEMYVVTASNVLFKSADGGANWVALSPQQQSQQTGQGGIPLNPGYVYPPAGFTNIFGTQHGQLQTFLMDPNNPATLYAGSSEGLHRSTNGGFTWVRLNVLIPPEALPVTAVAVFPRNPNMLFVGATSQVHRSDDGGINWSAQTLPTTLRIKSIAIEPLKPQVMFLIIGK